MAPPPTPWATMVGLASDPVAVSIEAFAIARLTQIDWRSPCRPGGVATGPVVTLLRCALAGEAKTDSGGVKLGHDLLCAARRDRDARRTNKQAEPSRNTRPTQYARAPPNWPRRLVDMTLFARTISPRPELVDISHR